VWCGVQDDRDVAIVHAPGLEPIVLPFAGGADCVVGAPVLCAGAGRSGGRIAAGCITDVAPLPFAPGMTKVMIDAPLTPGDSGGPVILADGRLVGIAYRASRSSGHSPSTASVLSCDADWIATILVDDRARQSAEQRPVPPISVATLVFDILDQETIERIGRIARNGNDPH